MVHNIEFKNIEPDDSLRNLIESLIGKVNQRASRFPPEEVYLRVMIEQNNTRTLFHVSVVLEIPGTVPASKKTIPAKAERHDLTESLRDAFAEIEEQLEAYKSTLRAEHLWKRRTRRKELH
jgi:ribosome-associated translation inhibitor RaiA